MTTFELRPAGTDPVEPTARQIEWPLHLAGGHSAVIIDADAFLSSFGDVPPAAVDLARVAVGAYLADRLVARSGVSWSRNITLAAHLIDPAGFAPAVEPLTEVLRWVTGDTWTIRPVADGTVPPAPAAAERAPAVCLTSGGLDSLCGALLSPKDTVLIGHRDTRVVAHSQAQIRPHLQGRLYQQIRVGIDHPRERSSRGRSIMFTALGTALAAAHGAGTLIVPENGFTSLNPPLSAARGGPHTTRSTHPTTIAFLNAINELLNLNVELTNPYQWYTKGELIKLAAASIGAEQLKAIIPLTFSCATANTQFFRGGSAFLNCGVCIACMTRRGAIRVSGLTDATEYTVDVLARDVRRQFLAERGRDVTVVTALRGWRPDIAKLIAMGPFPEGFDYERAADLLIRGFQELSLGLP